MSAVLISGRRFLFADGQAHIASIMLSGIMKRDSAPEVEVMLLCAQPVRTDVDLDRIRALATSELNWDFL